MSVFPQSPLLSAVNEKFCIMEKRRQDDDAGGSYTEWVEGLEFDVAPSLDNDTEARIGEVQGLTSVFTFLIPRGIDLVYHDVIKRKRDGKTFRITSDSGEEQTPSISAMSMRSVSAEEWALTRELRT